MAVALPGKFMFASAGTMFSIQGMFAMSDGLARTCAGVMPESWTARICCAAVAAASDHLAAVMSAPDRNAASATARTWVMNILQVAPESCDAVLEGMAKAHKGAQQ